MNLKLLSTKFLNYIMKLNKFINRQHTFQSYLMFLTKPYEKYNFLDLFPVTNEIMIVSMNSVFQGFSKLLFLKKIKGKTSVDFLEKKLKISEIRDVKFEI